MSSNYLLGGVFSGANPDRLSLPDMPIIKNRRTLHMQEPLCLGLYANLMPSSFLFLLHG